MGLAAELVTFLCGRLLFVPLSIVYYIDVLVSTRSSRKLNIARLYSLTQVSSKFATVVQNSNEFFTPTFTLQREERVPYLFRS